MCRSKDGDDTVEIPTLCEDEFAESEEPVDEETPSPDELKSLSAPEREWLMWFYSLSAENKKVVKICAERGISVNAANIEQMRRIVKNHKATDPDQKNI